MTALSRTMNALRLQFTVQARGFFPHIYFALALLTVAGFRLALPEAYRSWLLPPFLLGDPAVLGVSLVAAQRYLEKSQRSFTALVVTPLRDAEYVAALVLTSSLLATSAGVLIQAGVIGIDRHLILLVPPLFLMATIAGLAGVALSTYASEFTDFILSRLVPATVLLQAPMLAYFEVVPRFATAFVPSHPALFSFAVLSAEAFDPGRYLLYLLQLSVWTVLASAWALYAFRTRVRARLEEA